MYYAFTNESIDGGKMYKNYHTFETKIERDEFLKKHQNAFALTAKEFNHDLAYIKKYSDVCNFCTKIIEH